MNVTTLNRIEGKCEVNTHLRAHPPNGKVVSNILEVNDVIKDMAGKMIPEEWKAVMGYTT